MILYQTLQIVYLVAFHMPPAVKCVKLLLPITDLLLWSQGMKLISLLFDFTVLTSQAGCWPYQLTLPRWAWKFIRAIQFMIGPWIFIGICSPFTQKTILILYEKSKFLSIILIKYRGECVRRKLQAYEYGDQSFFHGLVGTFL